MFNVFEYSSLIEKFLEEIPEILINHIKNSKNVAIVGHLDPDGDTIGSQLGLKYYLESAGYNTTAINQGPFELNLKKYNNEFVKSIDREYDLYIVLDTPDLKRIGKIEKKIEKKKTIVIDHHFTNTRFGAINWINEAFVSTAEMVFLLIIKLGFKPDNIKANQFLLNGIVSDTGFFQHIRKEKNFALLASYILIQNGADPALSYNELYGQKTLENKKFLALILSRIEPYDEGEILWTYITKDDRKRFKNTQLESFFVFREMLTIDTAKVSILFKEFDDRVEVSFRSFDKVDVATLAKEFGGGGHKAASGVVFNKNTLKDIKDYVLKKTSEYIKTHSDLKERD